MAKYLIGVGLRGKIEEGLIDIDSKMNVFNRENMFFVLDMETNEVERITFGELLNKQFVGNDKIKNIKIIGSKTYRIVAKTRVYVFKINTVKMLCRKMDSIVIEKGGMKHDLDLTAILSDIDRLKVQEQNKAKEGDIGRVVEESISRVKEGTIDKEKVDVEVKERTDKIEDSTDELERAYGVENADGVEEKADEQLEDTVFGSEFEDGRFSLDDIMTPSSIGEKILDTTLKGMDSCPLCNGTGVYMDKELHIPLICPCTRELEARKQRAMQIAGSYKPVATNDDIHRAVLAGIIDPNREGDDFNKEVTKRNIDELWQTLGLMYYPSECAEFLNRLENILNTIRLTGTLNKSYIICSPEGTGKQTFVNTCLGVLFGQGKKCVPFRSLKELAKKRSDYNRYINGEYVKYSIDKNEFTWEDVLNADVLFTFIASKTDAQIEFDVLCELLSERSHRGLPTVACAVKGVKSYLKEGQLDANWWYNYLTYAESNANLCRMLEVTYTHGFKKGENKWNSKYGRQSIDSKKDAKGE